MPAGYPDPDRRSVIARAAISVVAERGVEGLTHRAVAAAADLPLGSTTYHFRSLDDLLAAAISEAKAAADAELEAWVAELGPEPDLAAALAALLLEWTTTQRDQAIVEYELYVAALRRPALREIAHEWDRALRKLLERYTDGLTARIVATIADGIVLQSLIHDEQLHAAEVERMLRRILG